MINGLKIFLLVLCCVAFCANAKTLMSLRDPFVPIASQPIISSQSHQIIPVNAIPLKSCWIPLYFTKASTVVSFISKKNTQILSLSGKISADKLNNQIWVQDDGKHLAIIRALIKHLDQPSSQFLIKAKIINLDRDYQRALGILLRGENANTSSTTTSSDQSSHAVGDFTFTIAKFTGNHWLDVQLSALEQNGHATLISNPSLVTLNNKPAVIESGSEVPYQEATSSGATSVSFKKAVLRLQVTPQRMPNHHILLHISLNQDKVSALTVQGVPAIQTQKISTEVVVRNRETIVLGGILETTRANEQQGIPILDQLPAIGALFQHHTNQTKRQELLIFITPSMMKSLY